MYLCLCNGLSDTRIEDAIRAGARRPRDVYRHCGCSAQCGRCTASILGALRAAPPPPSAKQDR
jgi:bacterioferritin-associated ferredoxin